MTLATSAKRVFDRLGTPITYTRTTKGAFDPVSGSYGPGETAEYPIKVAPPSHYELKNIDGSLVQRGDLQVTIAAESLPFAPALTSSSTGDKIEIDGDPQTIININTKYAGDEIVVYEVQVRG